MGHIAKLGHIWLLYSQFHSHTPQILPFLPKMVIFVKIMAKTRFFSHFLNFGLETAPMQFILLSAEKGTPCSHFGYPTDRARHLEAKSETAVK